MNDGTQEKPFTDSDTLSVARYYKGSHLSPDGGRGIVEHRGAFFEWYGGRWKWRSDDQMRKAMWRWLEGKHCLDANGGISEYRPTGSKISDIVEALAAVTSLPDMATPMWIRPGLKNPLPEPTNMIAFEDVLVDLGTGETRNRDSNWFDSVIIPVEYNCDAKCPRWDKCLEEWSDQDQVWMDLLQRWIGYCITPHRKYAKWLLMYGKVRAGKGLIARIVRALIGKEAFMNSSLGDLASSFGLAGMQHTRVLNIAEFSDLMYADAQRAVQILKNIVGQDPITIDAKYKAQMRNVEVLAAPMMQSNEIPTMPNRARGLSSKMLMLPFDVTFEGREDTELEEELLGELTGIAMWALRGAFQLRKATPTTRWPKPARAVEEERVFHMVNNPFDLFLESRFMKNPNGKVANSVIKREFKAWLRKGGGSSPLHKVTTHALILKIVIESSWSLGRSRYGETRFLTGLTMKKDRSDDVV